MDELTFVMGPAIVGLLASLVAPWLPLALAAALTLLLVPAFAVHRTGTAVPQHGRAGHGSAGRWDRGRLLRVAVAVAGMVGMGTLLGSTAAGAVAFAGDQGQPSAGGLLYAALGLASAAAALSVSAWPSGRARPARWVACSAALVPWRCCSSSRQARGAMVLVLLLVGLPVGPVMVTVFTVGGDVAAAAVVLLAAGILMVRLRPRKQGWRNTARAVV